MFTYNKEQITIDSISAFDLSAKGLNDKNNKTRENIIGSIINSKVPVEFYEIPRWLQLKTSIHNYITELDKNPFDKIDCKHKGGRKFNFDFNFVKYSDVILHSPTCSLFGQFNDSIYF